MSRVLVTGGAGFIGSHVAEALARRGHQVTALDDLSGGFRDNIVPDAAFVEGSITDVALVNHVFAEGRFDYVFHLAALRRRGPEPLHPALQLHQQRRRLGQFAQRGHQHGCDGVSCSPLPSRCTARVQLPMTEDHAARPEDSVRHREIRGGDGSARLPRHVRAGFIVFRPHNVYGARQHIGDRYRNVVGIFMNQMMRGQPMSIFGDGTQTRAFSYIDDVAPIIADRSTCPRPEPDVQRWRGSIVHAERSGDRVATAMGVEPRIAYLEARQEVRHAHSSHDNVRRVFGDRPHTTLDDGLRTMAAWVRERGARSSAPFRDIEVTRNLPAAWRSA